MGYMIAMAIQLTQSYIIIYVWLGALWFPVAHCVFLIAFCTDIENELRMLDRIITLSGEQEKIFSTTDLIKIKKRLRGIIRFQCDAKQLS